MGCESNFLFNGSLKKQDYYFDDFDDLISFY